MLTLTLYLLTGACTGILAGLLGIGGAIIVVPVLVKLFTPQFPPDLVMHLAVGSSLAIMIFTTLSAAYAYYRRGLISFPLFYKFTPGLIVGAITGSFISRQIPSRGLAIFFGIFMLVVAVNLFFSKKFTVQRPLPGLVVLSSVAFLIGILSGILGVGGGTMMVPFFAYCQIEMHKVTGTSSLCGLSLALTGTLCFIITGWTASMSANLPTGTTGYIYWPAVISIASASLIFAPLGTRLAVLTSGRTLKRIFALLLVVTAYSLLRG